MAEIYELFAGRGSPDAVLGAATKDATPQAAMYANLYLQRRLNLDDLVSKRIALRDVNDGYAALREGAINRVVVTSF